MSPRVRRRVWARPLVLAVLALLFGAGLLFLFRTDSLIGFPNWFWPHPPPWWWPYHAQHHVFPADSAWLAAAAAALFLGAACCAHASRARVAALLLLATLCLNAAALRMPDGGLGIYARRLVRCGHAELFARAASEPDLWRTLTDYEGLMRDGDPSSYARNKNPATLGFYVLLHQLAQAPGIRDALDRAAAREPGLRRSVYRGLKSRSVGRFRSFDRLLSDQMLRAFLLMPLVAAALRCAMVCVAFWLACALWSREIAACAAVTVASVTPILAESVQLDGSLYPLLFVAGLALFVRGRRTGRSVLLVAAGVVTAAYLYFTLAALVLVAICGSTLAFDAAAGGAGLYFRARARTREALLFAAGFALTLLLAWLLLRFHPIDRYLGARAVQGGWRGGEARWRWTVLDGVELFVSLGPVIGGLTLVGVTMSVVALLRRRVRLLHALALATFGAFVLLVAFTDYSEVYRLWAFMGLAFAIPAVQASHALLDLGRAPGRLVHTLAVLSWLLVAMTHFGHYG